MIKKTQKIFKNQKNVIDHHPPKFDHQILLMINFFPKSNQKISNPANITACDKVPSNINITKLDRNVIFSKSTPLYAIESFVNLTSARKTIKLVPSLLSFKFTYQ